MTRHEVTSRLIATLLPACLLLAPIACGGVEAESGGGAAHLSALGCAEGRENARPGTFGAGPASARISLHLPQDRRATAARLSLHATGSCFVRGAEAPIDSLDVCWCEEWAEGCDLVGGPTPVLTITGLCEGDWSADRSTTRALSPPLDGGEAEVMEMSGPSSWSLPIEGAVDVAIELEAAEESRLSIEVGFAG